MRGMRKLMMKTAILTVALLPMIAAVSPEAAPSVPDSPVSVAIAQPLAAMDGAPIVSVRRRGNSSPMLTESGMLVLVGSSLFALAALVRRAT
jgi:hypothetical protein